MEGGNKNLNSLLVLALKSHFSFRFCGEMFQVVVAEKFWSRSLNAGRKMTIFISLSNIENFCVDYHFWINFDTHLKIKNSQQTFQLSTGSSMKSKRNFEWPFKYAFLITQMRFVKSLKNSSKKKSRKFFLLLILLKIFLPINKQMSFGMQARWQGKILLWFLKKSKKEEKFC